jgi:hypothetical protein
MNDNQDMILGRDEASTEYHSKYIWETLIRSFS